MKRVKALDRAKEAIKNQTAQLEAAALAKHRLETEIAALRGQVSDKAAAITRLHEQGQLLQKEINAMSLERDRIMRIVDQFLSVQILGHGQTLTGPNTSSQQPKDLRRT